MFFIFQLVNCAPMAFLCQEKLLKHSPIRFFLLFFESVQLVDCKVKCSVLNTPWTDLGWTIKQGCCITLRVTPASFIISKQSEVVKKHPSFHLVFNIYFHPSQTSYRRGRCSNQMSSTMSCCNIYSVLMRDLLGGTDRVGKSDINVRGLGRFATEFKDLLLSLFNSSISPSCSKQQHLV